MTVINVPSPIKKYVKITTSDVSERVFLINWLRFVLFFLLFALIFVTLLMIVLMIHKDEEKPLGVHDIWPALSQLEEKIIDAIKHQLGAQNQTHPSKNLTGLDHSNATTPQTGKLPKPSYNNTGHIVGWIEDFMDYYHKHVITNKTKNEAYVGKENNTKPHFSMISITDSVFRVQPLKGAYGVSVTNTLHKVILVQLHIPQNESLLHANLGIPQPNVGNKTKGNGCKRLNATKPSNEDNSHNKTLVDKELLCNYNLNASTETVEEDTVLYKKIQLFEVQWTNNKSETLHNLGYSVTKIFTYSIKNSTTQTIFVDVTSVVSRWLLNPSKTYGFYIKFQKNPLDEILETMLDHKDSKEILEKEGSGENHDKNSGSEENDEDYQNEYDNNNDQNSCNKLLNKHVKGGGAFRPLDKDDKYHPQLITLSESKY